MTVRQAVKGAVKAMTISAGVAAAGYAGLVVYNRLRYGKVDAGCGPVADQDLLLDEFIAEPEVSEHHSIRIAAPAAVVLAAAKEMELLNSRVVRTLIRARELALGGTPDRREHPTRLMPQMLSIGWVVLGERPDREVVFGAATQPWTATPMFRSIPADEFASFNEPGYVKIAWTLRVEPLNQHESTFHTETRVVTTDRATRDHFRRYWSFVAPGVELIRMTMLRPLKREAERRARLAA